MKKVIVIVFAVLNGVQMCPGFDVSTNIFSIQLNAKTMNSGRDEPTATTMKENTKHKTKKRVNYEQNETVDILCCGNRR